MSFAVEQEVMDSNQLRGIKLLPEAAARQPVLQLQDEARLLEASPKWLADIIVLAVATGCRMGELLSLRWKHLDFDAGDLVVEDSKSGESRRIPLHPGIRELLWSRRGLPEGYVVTGPDGTLPSQEKVSHAFKEVARKMKREDLRFHDLRHVAATRLLATGASLPEVASYLGHKTLYIARRYAQPTRTRMHELVALMPGPTTDASA